MEVMCYIYMHISLLNDAHLERMPMPRSPRLLALYFLLLPACSAAAQDLNLVSRLTNGGMSIVVIGVLPMLMLAVCPKTWPMRHKPCGAKVSTMPCASA